ncbi:hypothetical protein BKA83DRAFT_4128957 [Pisolithus microcarpus]|nr:hypothetical protein BKA83DRAFT_4128957 [Pisolithus microcarpus]
MPRYQVLVDLVEALPEEEWGKGREVALPHRAMWMWSAKYLPQEIYLGLGCFWKALWQLQSAKCHPASYSKLHGPTTHLGGEGMPQPHWQIPLPGPWGTPQPCWPTPLPGPWGIPQPCQPTPLPGGGALPSHASQHHQFISKTPLFLTEIY